MKVINKIAFLVHEPILYTHYASVWAEMNRSDFVIVFYHDFSKAKKGPDSGAQELFRKIDEDGYEWQLYEDLVYARIKFRYVISNHKIFGSELKQTPILARLTVRTKNRVKRVLNRCYQLGKNRKRYTFTYRDPVQYAPLQIGVKQIRFMYGADIGDGWSLQDWNQIYDMFLCHGPNDEAQLKKRFLGKTALMGYPRYDRYFSGDLDVGSVFSEFEIDPSKQTILWMPTLGDDACSIPFFAHAISNLFSEYNVIVRPHPLSFRVEPEKIDLLRSLSFAIDAEATRDMNALFKVADIVFCDYGGSAFGAIYLDKKLILLEVPGADDQFTVKNSSNQELRGSFPTVSSQLGSSLKAILEDEKQWRNQEIARRQLFLKYFADNRGNSSRRAAEILGNLDLLLEGAEG